jgi:hypothetical protein
MNRTYVTDLMHYLDDTGEVPQGIPTEARQLASFLGLIVDAVTSRFAETESGIQTAIRCRARGCQGMIIAALADYKEPVHWHCPKCGDRGTISNWQKTKWDNVGS